MNWQPIETAPENEEFLCYVKNGDYDTFLELCMKLRFPDGDWEIVGARTYVSYTAIATHWMPLPNPPAA